MIHLMFMSCNNWKEEKLIKEIIEYSNIFYSALKEWAHTIIKNVIVSGQTLLAKFGLF